MTTEGSVLLIDGELAAGRLASAYLGEFFDVHWVPTGCAARAILDGAASDVVILEYQLPDCSGLDLISQIRRNHAELPIVMATGHGSEQICALAFRVGVGDYLAKPVREDELVASVRRLVQGRLRKVRDAGPSMSALPSGAPVQARLEWVARYVRERYADPLSVGELACKADMNRSFLSRRFSAYFHVSIRMYIAQVRVARAMQLLARADMPVTRIAQEVGFYDLPRFDKVFRRLVGMSPSAYRPKHKTASLRSHNY
jgi:two-component system response regulator YesN